MAILSTVKKIIPYLKTTTGYVLYRLSSQAVEMDDGTILQDKIESMDSTINTKAPNSHSHTGNQINGLTPSRALISGTLGQITESAVTSTEIQYLDGVTSNIQTQLNNKAANSHTHTATQVTGLTASRAMISDSSGHPSVSNVTSTELNYLDGATSNIQNQINTLNSNLGEISGSIDNKVKMINAKINTDPYGQCNLKYLVGNSAVLCVQIDGGYGAFCMTDTNIRVFRVSQLPFTFASKVELNAYIFYCPSFTVG